VATAAAAAAAAVVAVAAVAAQLSLPAQPIAARSHVSAIYRLVQGITHISMRTLLLPTLKTDR
jgi:hypothetical protein